MLKFGSWRTEMRNGKNEYSNPHEGSRDSTLALPSGAWQPGLQALADSIKANRTMVCSLNISNTNLASEGAKLLASALGPNKSLSKLVFTCDWSTHSSIVLDARMTEWSGVICSRSMHSCRILAEMHSIGSVEFDQQSFGIYANSRR